MHTKTFTKLALGAAAAATLAIAAPASAATIIKPVIGCPCSPANEFGTIQAIKLNTANTYDFTFDIGPGGDVLSQLQATIAGPIPQLIQFDLFSGVPGSGTLLGDSPLATTAVFETVLNPGSYYLEVDYIAKNKELLTGGLDVTTAVPEPATWAMLLVGFGGLGAMVRSRRKTLATA